MYIPRPCKPSCQYGAHSGSPQLYYNTSDMDGQVWGKPELSKGFQDGSDHACIYMYLNDMSLAFLDLDVLSMHSGPELGLSLGLSRGRRGTIRFAKTSTKQEPSNVIGLSFIYHFHAHFGLNDNL